MSTIQLRTTIPGPRSQALMKRRDAAVVQAAYHATPVFVAKAEGAVISLHYNLAKYMGTGTPMKIK